MKIAVGTLKGGCGTSTLACNLAVGMQRGQGTVAIVDTDQSLASSSWSERRGVLGIEPRIRAVVPLQTAHEILSDSLLEGAGSWVADVSRHMRAENTEFLASRVDFWIAPSMASAVDLHAALNLHDDIRRVRPRGGGPHVPFGVVLTQTCTAPGSRQTSAARAYLRARAPDMLVFAQSLSARTAWQITYDGRSLYELPQRVGGKAVRELDSVLREILAALHASIPRVEP